MVPNFWTPLYVYEIFSHFMLHFKNTSWDSLSLDSLFRVGRIIRPAWLNSLSLAAELAGTQNRRCTRGRNPYRLGLLKAARPQVESASQPSLWCRSKNCKLKYKKGWRSWLQVCEADTEPGRRAAMKSKNFAFLVRGCWLVSYSLSSTTEVDGVASRFSVLAPDEEAVEDAARCWFTNSCCFASFTSNATKERKNVELALLPTNNTS